MPKKKNKRKPSGRKPKPTPKRTNLKSVLQSVYHDKVNLEKF